ncbi:ferroxidase [Dacryopinax primogenitus]|uniref:Ferroxidase n=1 Tax=Dacryopinax primogenitus (strain DJM 731) TaxID=1858805 RepID=M5G6N1_DACPD|nr:ferroxidase [Dacryopinax primogenitus]EJU03865.1 ferroxidase [Dacryopinax primogenitus]
MLSALFAFAALTGVARAALSEHWWNISYAYTNPDAMFERRVIGINGTWPPPPVTVNQGDQLIIHVTNGLGDANTGIHTHGIYFNGSGYYDGAVYITQCPIQPGDTLTYEIPTDLNTGTYWIHGHYRGQYVDGLRTPLVINPPTNAYNYDEEYTLVLGDWYHDQHDDLLAIYMNPFDPTGAEPIPKGAIAFVASGNPLQYMDSNEEIGVGTGVSSANKTGAILNFESGKTYRIRLINEAAFAMFYFSMAGHTMQVIEVDGTDTEPYAIEHIWITAAQRYSILVQARNDTSQNWPIMMNMDGEMFDSIPDDLVLNITAHVVYDATQPLPEPEFYDSYPMWNDTVFTPLDVLPNVPADQSITMNIWFEAYTDGINYGSFNNITFRMPIVPSLYTQLSMGSAATDPAIFGAQTNAFVLNHLDNVELMLYNWHTDNHPFHLHGHKFQVVYMSQDVMSDDPTINPPFNEVQANPMRRDTVMVPAGGLVRVRFRADNPGAWLFHCHIEWHLDAGLAAVFIEAPLQAQANLQVPQSFLDSCTAQNIPYTGNIVGLNSTTDFDGEPYGPWPQETIFGWTNKAMGAMAGCIIAAVIGCATVVWYAMNPFQDDEREELAIAEFEKKQMAGGKLGFFKKLVPGKKNES